MVQVEPPRELLEGLAVRAQMEAAGGSRGRSTTPSRARASSKSRATEGGAGGAGGGVAPSALAMSVLTGKTYRPASSAGRSRGSRSGRAGGYGDDREDGGFEYDDDDGFAEEVDVEYVDATASYHNASLGTVSHMVGGNAPQSHGSGAISNRARSDEYGGGNGGTRGWGDGDKDEHTVDEDEDAAEEAAFDEAYRRSKSGGFHESKTSSLLSTIKCVCLQGNGRAIL